MLSELNLVEMVVQLGALGALIYFGDRFVKRSEKASDDAAAERKAANKAAADERTNARKEVREELALERQANRENLQEIAKVLAKSMSGVTEELHGLREDLIFGRGCRYGAGPVAEAEDADEDEPGEKQGAKVHWHKARRPPPKPSGTRSGWPS